MLSRIISRIRHKFAKPDGLCYVCGRMIMSDDSTTYDIKRELIIHFRCWTKLVKGVTFYPPNSGGV